MNGDQSCEHQEDNQGYYSNCIERDFGNSIDKSVFVRDLKMELIYKKAVKDDANLLIEIYNSSFYDDYAFYGECIKLVGISRNTY